MRLARERRILAKFEFLIRVLTHNHPHYDIVCLGFWKQKNRVSDLEQGENDGC